MIVNKNYDSLEIPNNGASWSVLIVQVQALVPIWNHIPFLLVSGMNYFILLLLGSII